VGHGAGDAGNGLSVEPLAKVSLCEKFAAFDDLWSPKTIAHVDDFAIKLAKIDGEFVWHHHADADEVFLVVSGRIVMKYRSEDPGDDAVREVAFGAGELLRVPRGVEHLPVADPGTEVLLFERADVVNTGNVENERTRVATLLR
jgi:mannose-6-phosphate isomerase-like protein (cupin superfamily)